MSATSEGIITMKLISSSGEKISKKMSENKLPLFSLDDVNSSKDQLVNFPIGLDLSNFNSGKKTESSSPHLQFNSTNSFLLPMQNSTGSKPKKRTRSKPGPKNPKKGRLVTSSNSPDDKALDTDIFAFVESLDTNKNLDSDSSTNTIILDELNDQPSNNEKNEESKLCVNSVQNSIKPSGKFVFKDIDFQGRNDVLSSVTAISSYNAFPILSSNKIESNLQLGPKEISTNFYNSSKGRVIISQVPTSVSEISFPLIKPVNTVEIPQKTLIKSESNIALLSKVNSKNIPPGKFIFKNDGKQDESGKHFLDSSQLNPISLTTSNSPSILRSLITKDYYVNSSLAKSHPVQETEKSIKILCSAQVPEGKGQLLQGSVSSTSLFVPNVCQYEQKIHSQSVYASMGLDEDLCDVDVQNHRQKLNSKSTSKNSIFSTVKLNVKIDNDKSSSFISNSNKKNGLIFDSKNEILPPNDLHVSMTFEAEPSVDDDDEDDLPLSQLKNQISAEEIVPKMKEKSEELNNFIADNVSDINPSLFIKKELIEEDEIVSESQAVSSKNMLTVSNASCSTEVNTSFSVANGDFIAVKIKTEPKDDYSGPESTKDFQTSLNYNQTQVSANDTSLISKVCLKQDSVLEPTVNKNVYQPYAMIGNTMSPSLVSKSQSKDLLNVNNVSCLASTPSFGSIDPSFAVNISDTCITVTKGSKTSGASKKRKSYAQNTKASTKNIKNSSLVDFEFHTSLTKEALQNFRMFDENSDVSSSQHVTDTDTESNSSKKKGKRKQNSKQSVNIDENLPITLLIKRQKSDTADENASNSFLCTNISKSGSVETKSLSSLSPTDKTLPVDSRIKIVKESMSSDIVDAYFDSQNLIKQQKNKRSYKKKETRKPKGKNLSSNICNEVMQYENQFSNSQNAPIKPNNNTCSSNSQPNSTKSESPDLSYSQFPKCSNSLKSLNVMSTAEQKGEAYVYMTFEEHSPAEEISEEDMNSVLPVKKEKDPSPPRDSGENSTNVSPDILSVIKNIKQEKEDSLLPESKASEISNILPPDNNPESTHLCQAEETLSTISSVASNSNIEEDSNISAPSNFDSSVSDFNVAVQSKKKKRRPRSNGWYKKKKSKVKAQNLPSVEIKEPTNLPAMAANKVPVVVIKNLLPEMKLLKGDGNVVVNKSVSAEQETVELPVKAKKKKRTSHKRKKAGQLSENCSNNEAMLHKAGSECQRGAELFDNPLQSESVQLPEKSNFGSNVSTNIPVSVSDQCSAGSETISENLSKFDQMNPTEKMKECNENHVHSSPVSEAVNSHYSVYPSLDVDEILQEIKACEAFLHNFGDSSDKSRPSTSCCDSRNEINVQSKVPQPNILETFNSSFKSGKSKSLDSFAQFASVQIKKELDDDLKTLVDSPKDILFSSNKNDKSDGSCNVANISTENDCVHSNKESSAQNVDCNLPLANLSSLKKEKERNGGIKSKSLSSSIIDISDGSAVENSSVNNQSDEMIDSVSKANTCAAQQSETLKNVAQKSLSLDIDKIALSIKKEVYGDAKSRSSNYSIKDQNDLIQKACVAQTGKLNIASNLSNSTTKTKSACSMPSSSSGSSQIDNLAQDDEIQIVRVANLKTSKAVPIVDLTDDNIISNTVVESQYAISRCKDKPIHIPSVHVSIAQASNLSCSATEINTVPGCSTKISSLQSSAKQVNTSQDCAIQSYTVQGNIIQASPSQNNSKNVNDELYQLNTVFKAEKTNIKSSVVGLTVSDSMLKEKSSLGDENKQSVINNKKKEPSLPAELGENNRKLELLSNNEDSLESLFTKEKEDSAVKIEISNSGINRDKYSEDYFKHPFPPSVVLHNIKQRNKNKMYTRINSKAWNLSIGEIEARLKLSENIVSQLGKKLGDVVRLEKYPVSISEVECYHRILGVAPSHKLLSKCFKSPDKKANTFMNNGFNAVFPGFQQANANRFETDKQYNKTSFSLDDILKGITETKMMYSNNNTENNLPVCEKDGPSTETRDSCDSYISNMSASQSRDFKTSDNLNEKIEFMQVSSHNENSNGRNSALSCRTPSFNESDLTNLNFMVQKSSSNQFVSLNTNENVNPFPSQNTLNYLNLPAQEIINNIVNNIDKSSSCVSTYDNASNYFSGSKSNNVNNIESQSSNSCHSCNASVVFKTNDESKLQSEKKQIFDIDVPVTELRKILETAGSLRSDAVNYDDGCLWKSKATFEYNHTQSVPVVGKNSENKDLGIAILPSKIVPCSSYASHLISEQQKGSSRHLSTEAGTVAQSTHNDCAKTVKENAQIFEPEQDSSTKKTVHEDSDNDYVDNEPICNDEYDRETDENSSHADEHANEECVIPQYKSKWEKIMERKSLENKERKVVNEHLLKDCFPVSSTRTQNKASMSQKNVCKTNEEFESSKKGTSEKRQNKDDKIDLREKDLKQSDSNSSKSKTAKQNNKSSKNSKVKVEKNKTKRISEKETKSKAFLSKKNKVSIDDASNLFVPDKPIKISKELKPDRIQQSNENDKSNRRFYGNRVTNRGTFLTESSSSAELLKKIKIPKKKKLEIPKKHSSVRSEEFHSMVKSPDINIEPTFRSSYKNYNKSFDSRKSSESYRSPLEGTSSSLSASSHFIRTKQIRDRRMYHSNFHHRERQGPPKPRDPRSNQFKRLHDENIPVRRPPLLSTPPNISPLINDESSIGRKPALLSTPSIPFLTNDDDSINRKGSQYDSMSSHYSNDGSIIDRNNSLLGSLPSISSHPYNDECLLGKKIPGLTPPSISPQLPMESCQPNVNSQMNLLHKIISAINSNKISSVPNMNEDELPFPDCKNPFRDKYEPNSLAYSHNESSTRQSMNVQSILPSEPSTSVNKSSGNIPPLDIFNTMKPSSTHPFSTVSSKNSIDSPFDSSDILNSPPFTASANSSTHIPPQPTRKASCLVPQHLKALVGHKTIETHNVRLLMLEWSVDWLVQQQQFHDPPPISNALKKVVSTYDSFEDYYNTYFPLMLLDTWHRIYVSWTHLNQANPYSCQITSYSVKSQYVSVECQTVFNTAAHPKGVFPDEGSILMVKYSTKSNEYTIKILGYVTNVKTRRFNSVTDSKLFSSLRLNKDANPDVLQILSLTFMGAYNSEDIDKRHPIRIHVLCNVKPTLKQNDAMLYINNSPLQRSILNPVADGLLSFTLTPRNSPLEKISECVRDITKGILTPHPIPLLTVVRAKPESDRLNIIPMLIEKMKSAYKTKVLLCVRTVRALGDIAANICLHQSLKLVIINKRCDTNPQFQKYLLDDVVAAEMTKSSEDKVSEKPHAKSETIVKVRKQVLKECDVVLSLIRNCHDEFMCETFTETDCVSQMCCIVDEANLCTEPESLIPILHGVSKLILIGDPDYPAKVLSKTASSYDYSQSFFQRAYDLDLITE